MGCDDAPTSTSATYVVSWGYLCLLPPLSSVGREMDPTKRQGSLDGSQPEGAPAMSSGLVRGENTLQFLLVSPKYAWYMDAFGIFPGFLL